MLKIRPAEIEDIPLLSEYWYDNMVLLQQAHPHMRLLPDARQRWEQFARDLLRDSTAIFLVGQVKQEVIGGIAGRMTANQPGLAPELISVVEFLILDLHTPRQQQGAGRELLQALKTKFVEAGIEQIQVRVPAQAVVAQAFWRGMGTKKIADVFWINL